MVDITVIIVNYNTAKLIRVCLESLLGQSDVNFEIIVVDNASHDNSIKVLEAFNDRIRIIANQRNYGFAKANNQAILSATGRYVFLLNPDAKLSRPHDLRKIIEFMDQNARYGLVGTRIVNQTNTKETLPRYFYPGEKYIRSPFSALPGKIAWVLGASIVMPRDVYHNVGGFDEDFFLYGDEADLCLRVRRCGYEIGYYPDVTVVHLGGGSEHATDRHQLTLRKQRGLHLFYKKHYSTSVAQFLVTKGLRRARYRMLFYRIRSLLAKDKQLHDKYLRYKAIYDSSKAFIATL